MPRAEAPPAPVDMQSDGEGRIALTGELGFSTVPGVLSRLQDVFRHADHRLEVDLGGVSRSDSAGVALLIEWLRMARERGIELRFANVPEQMRSVARVTGVAELLTFD